MLAFKQSVNMFLEIPSIVHPYFLDPRDEQCTLSLEFEYDETTYSAILEFDTRYMSMQIQRVIFDIKIDDLGITHYSCTVMFKDPTSAPYFEHKLLQGTPPTIKDIVDQLSTSIAEEFIDKLYDNPLMPPNTATQFEYGPELRKSLFVIIRQSILGMSTQMPTYAQAYKMNKRVG